VHELGAWKRARTSDASERISSSEASRQSRRASSGDALALSTCGGLRRERCSQGHSTWFCWTEFRFGFVEASEKIGTSSQNSLGG